eukprot:Blabericola_migrator_1__5968@NODE_3007_length_2120_cov_11_279591_g1881_i0_p1_GENE_NODE_3007_length_2120_cov_11_279591_g1881_i0NODE_3007_length_2120_cov_11_279591_g1881_i0_p1_ORF_typecomplete_len374_score66_10cNMP_binding/PF00027_29/2_5e21cNMP_binding/PF00027_29/7_4e24Popeye/PF04831_13/1_1e02Popeye/PF04831_13/1_2DUF5403/PF17395_2/1_7_NODE_3007_length_2120_cov_11_279591_g1881_i07361857
MELILTQTNGSRRIHCGLIVCQIHIGVGGRRWLFHGFTRSYSLLHSKQCCVHARAEYRVMKDPSLLSSSDSEDDYDGTMGDVMDVPQGQRGAVSSEVPSSGKDFKPPFHEKTDDQIKRISSVITKSFLFSNLDSREFKSVIGAFEEKYIPEGEHLIDQGAEGDCLYLVESGIFDVWKQLPSDSEPKHVNEMKEGSTIGELALLYSCPRAATVIAREPSVVWKLDRGTFSNVVRASAMLKRERFTESLKKVPILKGLSEGDRVQLADALLAKDFAAGDDIVVEGDVGDDFYILESGAAEALKNGQPVMEYKPGDYFGELALINSAPRAATVRAVQDCRCLSLARASFTRLLGPLEQTLKDKATLYSDVPLHERQ